MRAALRTQPEDVVVGAPLNSLLDELYDKVALDLQALWDALDAEIAARE